MLIFVLASILRQGGSSNYSCLEQFIWVLFGLHHKDHIFHICGGLLHHAGQINTDECDVNICSTDQGMKAPLSYEVS